MSYPPTPYPGSSSEPPSSPEEHRDPGITSHRCILGNSDRDFFDCEKAHGSSFPKSKSSKAGSPAPHWLADPNKASRELAAEQHRRVFAYFDACLKGGKDFRLRSLLQACMKAGIIKGHSEPNMIHWIQMVKKEATDHGMVTFKTKGSVFIKLGEPPKPAQPRKEPTVQSSSSTSTPTPKSSSSIPIEGSNPTHNARVSIENSSKEELNTKRPPGKRQSPSAPEAFNFSKLTGKRPQKAWAMARRLKSLHWETCKIEFSLPHAVNFATRCFRAGLAESDMQKAYQAGLEHSHVLASDCGQVWAPSLAISRANKIAAALVEKRRKQISEGKNVFFFGEGWEARFSTEEGFYEDPPASRAEPLQKKAEESAAPTQQQLTEFQEALACLREQEEDRIAAELAKDGSSEVLTSLKEALSRVDDSLDLRNLSLAERFMSVEGSFCGALLTAARTEFFKTHSPEAFEQIDEHKLAESDPRLKSKLKYLAA